MSLEEHLLPIVELRKEGYCTSHVARNLGVSSTTIRRREESAKRMIRQAVKEGVDNINELSKRMKTSRPVLGMFMSYHEMTFSRKEGDRERTEKEKVCLIRQSLKEGRRSLEVLCRQIGSKPRYLFRLCQNYNLKLPDNLIPYRGKPEIDPLIKKGYTLGEMEKEVGITKQGIFQYLENYGWKKIWEKGKEKRREKELKQAEQLWRQWQRELSRRERKIDRLVRKKGCAYRDAVKYVRSCEEEVKTPFGTLVKFFQRYEEAKKKGKKLSLKELTEGIDLSYSAAGRILEKAGEAPLYGKREKRTTPPEKKEAIRRAHHLNMPVADIAYFLEVGKHVVTFYFRKRGRRSRSKRKIEKVIKGFGFSNSEGVLNRRLASQVYQGIDRGLSRKKVAYSLRITEKVVNYALENRREGRRIQREIIDALRVMYPGEKISRPYLK